MPSPPTSKRRIALLHALKTPQRIWYDERLRESFDGKTGDLVHVDQLAAHGLAERDGVYWRITVKGRRWLYAAATAPAACGEGIRAANATEAVRAAERTVPKVRWALQVLGDAVSEDAAAAARLRLEFPEASLAELGKRAVPPLSRHTVSGRLRRLLRQAEARARELHLPDAADT